MGVLQMEHACHTTHYLATLHYTHSHEANGMESKMSHKIPIDVNIELEFECELECLE